MLRGSRYGERVGRGAVFYFSPHHSALEDPGAAVPFLFAAVGLELVGSQSADP